MIIEHTGEDFNYHYGLKDLDWNNKIVLDLGADFGSTAKCFLEKGAKKVYAIEGDRELFTKLAGLCSMDENKYTIIPMMMFINDSKDFIKLISNIKCDICKMDIEGYEKHMIDVPNSIIREIKEYVIETHYNIDRDKIIDKFLKIGYELIDRIHLNSPECYVFYFIRKDV